MTERSASTPAEPDAERRVLSIQSHVVSGYVGNCAAVFPLQLFGYDVDVVNTCMLSNHLAYRHGATGLRFLGDDLLQIVRGLDSNHLLRRSTRVLTGYMGSPSLLHALVHTLSQLRDRFGSSLFYVCDPVLGDLGKLYVSKECVHVYRQHVLKYATILTPNAFELSLLTDKSIESERDAFHVCQILHAQYDLQTVFVTGTTWTTHDQVSTLISTRLSDGRIKRAAVDADKLSGTFSGTGDLMSALLLVWLERMDNRDAVEACRHAMASVTAVLIRTQACTQNEKREQKDRMCLTDELKIVQGQQDILKPRLELVRVRSCEHV